jgi:chlorobactene glucosyltransferase
MRFTIDDLRLTIGDLLAKMSLGAAVLSLPLAWRAERRYGQMGRLVVERVADELPSLSVIIPARNEAGNLPKLLASLTAVHYPGSLEIIVVDDNSVDETAVIAESYSAQVVRLTDLPAGWLGKPHACHRGAAVARGEWLLFTDADTVHERWGVATAVTYARQHQLDGLSAFLGQTTNSWWDRSTILTAFVGLFAGLPNLEGVMNGQYVLLRRDVYEACGGFAAVKHEPLEDLALGHRLHELGYRVPILRGETAASVRMYHDFPQMWQGLTRLGAGALRWSGAGSLVTALLTTLAALPLWLSPFVWIWGRLGRFAFGDWRLGRHSLVFSLLITAVGFMPAARRLGSGRWALLGPIGSLLVQTAGTWGLLRSLLGRGIQWKDRLV